MRTLFKTIAVAILIGCVFMAGALTAGIRHWQPLIEISVINNSGHHISDIQVFLETDGQKSVSTLGSVDNGQTRT